MGICGRAVQSKGGKIGLPVLRLGRQAWEELDGRAFCSREEPRTGGKAAGIRDLGGSCSRDDEMCWIVGGILVDMYVRAVKMVLLCRTSYLTFTHTVGRYLVYSL